MNYGLYMLLRKFTYKPDWIFSIHQDLLCISIIAPDTDNPKNTIKVNFTSIIPQYMKEDYPWDRWLLHEIMVVEKHEAEEFFKIDGVKVFDPHG